MINDNTPIDYLHTPQTTDHTWGLIIDALMDGRNIAPRGQTTRELLAVHATFDMQAPVLVCPTRKLNLDFMCDEALWMLRGSNSVYDLPYEFVEKFSDNGEIYNGAYGPHIVRQLPYVIRTLQNDPDSRQAVIQIWQERPEASKDIPCTLSMQFLLRGGTLHAVVNMRSSDAFLGLPYDVFNFSMVATYIAIELNACIGNLYWSAGSSHIYIKDIEKALECLKDLDSPKRFVPHGVTDTKEALVASLRDRSWVRGD